MKDIVKNIKQFVEPVKGLIFFLFLSALVVIIWKVLSLDTFLYGLLFPLNRKLILIESPVNHFLVSRIFSIKSEFDTDTIKFSNGYSLIEDPLCTGLKQIIQFSLILLVYPGPFRNKLWYIPCAWLILIMAAIFHLAILSAILALSPQNYNVFHEHFSRWFFFGIFFLLWIIWDEKFVKRKSS